MRNDNKGISRRDFTKKSATALAGISLLQIGSPLLASSVVSRNDIEVNLFSKHLQFLDYNEMCSAAADIGFNGLDLTVRPKGHVLPENVTEDLPKAVEAMKKYGLNPQMLTTNVWDISNETEQSQAIFLEQAAKLGEVNKKLGLIGCYQNHAGNHVGAPIWDLPAILSKADDNYMGCQYDIRHAVVEGGKSWELDLRRIEPLIKSIVIKDFKWGYKNGKYEPINTPLGEGVVEFDKYFSLLKKYKINVPISLHLEYDLGGAEHGAKEITMDKKEVFAKMKHDLLFIREAWQRAE